MTERRYALVRLSAGDYLLPSNDGQTLYRIAKYLEDGSLSEVEPRTHKHVRTIRGEYWSLRRFDRPLEAFSAEFERDEEILDDWNRWPEIEWLLPTRRAAIESALGVSQN